MFNFDQFNEEPEEIALSFECEPVNALVGKSQRKYGRIWNAYSFSVIVNVGAVYLETSPDTENEKLSDMHRQKYEAELKNRGLRSDIRITKDNLNDIFGGLVRDWDYLLKLLEALKNAKYANNVEDAFTYSFENDGSIIVRLKAV
jgi:hypothetical protein